MVEKNKKNAAKWVLLISSIASFMVSLDSQVVNMALNTLRLSFNVSIESLQWTVNAYNLSFAVLLLTGAALGERFGRKQIFISGLALFTLASIACAISPTIEWLITARVIQGAGAAMVTPLAMTLLGSAFLGGARAKALGIFSAVTGLAVLSGPVVGGAITQGLSWRWIFWINLPIGIMGILSTLKRIEKTEPSSATLDFRGVLLIALGVLGVVWGLMRGNDAGWTSLEVVGSFIVGIVFSGLFIRTELKERYPMLPMGMFRSKNFSLGNFAGFTLFATLFATLFFLAQFLQNVKGYDPFSAGLHLLPWTATLFVIAPIAGKLIKRLGERPLIAVGLLLQAIGLAWIGCIASVDMPYESFIAPFIIAGIGVSLAMPALQHIVLESVERHHIGKASGVFNTFRFLGGVFGVAIGVVLFSAAGNYLTAKNFSDGFSVAMLGSSLLAFIGAVASLFLAPKPAVDTLVSQ